MEEKKQGGGCFGSVLQVILLLCIWWSLSSASAKITVVETRYDNIEKLLQEQIHLQREYNQLLYRKLKDRQEWEPSMSTRAISDDLKQLMESSRKMERLLGN